MYPLWTGVLLFSAILRCVTSVVVDDVITSTRYGQILGQRHNESYGLENSVTTVIDKYLGVPYASPPVGHLRFQAPQPPRSWTPATHNSTVFGSVCPQLVFYADTADVYQSEDCLFLDIYSPYQEGQEDNILPVMIFIHGGSFEVGAGKLYDGAVLAQSGVVVVTINYRLGALGFMTSGDEFVPGNLGLLDQVEALRWVQENIGAFRGDSARVTVFGQSAGSASVGMLLIMPQTAGLFHAAICMSGSATASYGVYEAHLNHHQYVKDVAAIYDCPQSDNMDVVVTCLRGVPAQEFIERRREFPRYDPIDPEFKPLIDGTYIQDQPRNLFRQGIFHKVPLIMGTVKDEFANYFAGGERHYTEFDTALDDYIRNYVGSSDLMEMVQFVYTDWKAIPVTVHDRGALLSDVHMYAPTTDMLDLVSRHNNAVYQYQFSVDDCYHSVELNYMFGAPFSGLYADEMTLPGETVTYSESQRQQSIIVMKLWTDFAKYGNPVGGYDVGNVNCSMDSSQHNVEWPAYGQPYRQYLLIDTNQSIAKSNLRADKAAFWNYLIPKLTVVAVSSPSIQDSDSASSQVSVHVWVMLAGLAALVMIVACLTALLIRTKRSQETHTHVTEVTHV